MEETDNRQPVKDNMGGCQRFIKRLSDIIISTLLLIVLSPVFVILYICLRATSGKNVIFKQERIGKGGKPFMLYKYRTLKEHNEDEEPKLTPHSDPTKSTKLQLFLRKTHLDELPQLWNVLKGDMSLVGPRPERQYFINKIMEVDDGYQYIYLMRPGVTSEATIYNGYTDTIEKMVTRLHLDIEYLQKRTLLLDARIMFETVASIIRGKKI